MFTRVLILEDNVRTAEVIKRMILEVNHCVQVEIAETVAQGYVIAMEKVIDVFIVDIVLDTTHPGDTGGIIFAQKIREIPKYLFTPMIFITALADPEMYAYKEIHCFGYIEKPFDQQQVKQLLEKALLFSTYVEEDKKIFLRKDGILYAVNLKEIMYIHVRNHKMFLHTRNELVEIPYKTIKAFQNENENPCFLQCNRYTLINYKYIENIDFVNGCIKLKGIRKPIQIGVRYRNTLREWINAH